MEGLAVEDWRAAALVADEMEWFIEFCSWVEIIDEEEVVVIGGSSSILTESSLLEPEVDATAVLSWWLARPSGASPAPPSLSCWFESALES